MLLQAKTLNILGTNSSLVLITIRLHRLALHSADGRVFELELNQLSAQLFLGTYIF